MDRTVRLALGSVAVGCVVLGLKFLAWRLTGSVALYSDALESIINVAAACAAVVALRVSVRPADANHPYGHSKAEYFSAVLEGILIVVAALAILREVYGDLLDPRALEAPTAGLAINAVAGILNAVWAGILIRNGRSLRSPALVADGKHLFTDVVTSGGVLVGVAAVELTGWLILDPLFAALVALNILWSGWGVMRGAVGGLMDEATSEEVSAMIRNLIAARADGAIEAHDLRTRHAGRRVFIEFHLVVPGDMKVVDAHEICDRLEDALKADLPGSTVMIHLEPEHKAKQTGVPVL